MDLAEEVPFVKGPYGLIIHSDLLDLAAVSYQFKPITAISQHKYRPLSHSLRTTNFVGFSLS